MIQKKIKEKEKKEKEEKEKEEKEKEKKKREEIEKEKKEKKKSLTSYLDLFSYHLATQGQWHTLLLAFCCSCSSYPLDLTCMEPLIVQKSSIVIPSIYFLWISFLQAQFASPTPASLTKKRDGKT